MPYDNAGVLLPAVGATVIALAVWRLLISRSKSPTFPGPKGYPLIGNLLDVPTEHEYYKFYEWGRQYGPITSFTMLGQPMLVLNTPAAAEEMLDKKSAIYSDRPHLTMASDLVGWKDVLVLTPYGDRFKAYRRMMHCVVGTRAAVDSYNAMLEVEAQKAAVRIRDDPKEFREHIRKGVGASILMISHGYKVQGDSDELVRIADSATDQLNEIVSPGRFLVDQIPILRYVPEWVPGATFQRHAREWRATLTELTERSFRFVQQQISAGTAVPSLVSIFVDGKSLTPQEEANVKWAASSLYSGGADTPVSALSAFILALTMYPDALKKGQAEIDAVIGQDRIPGFADRDQLPYIQAMVQELLRWGAVAPLGAPHRLTRDDVHEGKFVPKGTIILVNEWGMMHDPDIYKDPMAYYPDRHLSIDGSKPERDPREICFGYGRRACPGLHIAESLMYIYAVTIVALFDITSVPGEVPTYSFTSGSLVRPVPFKCTIKPRSARAEALLQTLADSR
ncbi:hypothetical protein EVG20_g4713 [Dentipellis fragilis]|uniref:Cytochrome P450 n=1 Tax=Dentipellis fragilis TaxID=205917 RepID=A0A4Y9YXS6_9AGAM|nr:hypothetical protein EVG20_g4713 [Dentipellis fragilis]